MSEREFLKKEIINYLVDAGVSDKNLLAKALKAIKDAAYSEHTLDAEDMGQKHIKDYAKACGLAVGNDFYYSLSRSFAPRHYSILVGFVNRFEDIQNAEAKAEYELEAKIESEIFEQCMDPLADGYYDDLGAPDFAICIHAGHIEVRAFEKGVGDILPKQGRKYIGSQGDMRWSFPLSSLDALKRLNRPVVNVADLAA